MCNPKEIQHLQLLHVILDAQHILIMMIKIHLLFCLKLDKMLCEAFFYSTLTLSLKLGIKDKGICVDVFGIWYKIVREEKEY